MLCLCCAVLCCGLHTMLAVGVTHSADWLQNGLRPLHICCLRSLPRATHILLEYNADFTLACEAGYTPLHYACLSGDAECAGMLKRMGASLQAINRVGHQRAHTMGCRCPPRLMLRFAGAPMCVLRQAGHMPLECADSTGYPILRTVLDRVRRLGGCANGDAALMLWLPQAINLRDEALVRAKRFYVKQMEGGTCGVHQHSPDTHLVNTCVG